MNRLKELRVNNHYSQNELAKELGVNVRTLSSWELGDREMSYETLFKISSFFNCTIDYLLGNNPKLKVEDLQMDPVVVAFYDQAKDLSPESKEKIIEYARLLKIAENK